LRAKIRSSIFRPIACPNCGALFVVSRLALLLSLIVAEVLVFIAANEFERPSVGLMAAFLATLVGAGLIYSFGYAPLERVSRAEPAPTMRRTTYVFLAALIAALALVPIYIFMRA
jgi:hypothetical protein